ncbi:hypothetical protein PoB_005042900 [Plakobranchus ocellatus]|uniref:Uncharacterized protein n=1 Tax=Plakobranchus ocellatus TaxID=259542 RepID=A0AAV4BZS6_9GAST|nr:hypothetical protein PoB_005042900 [Plakobranchus ocellatus]
MSSSPALSLHPEDSAGNNLYFLAVKSRSEASSHKEKIPDIPENVSAEKEVIGADNENAAEMYQSEVDFPIQNKLNPEEANIRAENENAAEMYQSEVDFPGQNYPYLEYTAGTSAIAKDVPVKIVSPIPRPLKELWQRTNFCAKAVTDQRAPWIWDIQLLPGDRLLVADSETNCIKLFDTQGHQQETLVCRDSPYRLAVLDRSSESSSQSVAVTLPDCLGIDILEIRGYKMRVKRSLQTSRGYNAVAAVTKQTLAVGYFYLVDPGIDLIDIDGQVLRQICKFLFPILLLRNIL